MLSVKKDENFNLKATLECGQVFRYKINGGRYTVFSKDKMMVIEENESSYTLVEGEEAFFLKYFDFDSNYDIICSNIADDFVSDAMRFSRGIRLLNQDPAEMVFSFIISQNNHIPRIKAIIERLCDALGEDKGGYKAFPTVEALASKDADFYHKAGLGYRAEYIASAARSLCGEDFNKLSGMNTPELRNYLMLLKGVGRKVADCILLFGFSRREVFPVDTWIMKVFSDIYGNISADKLACLLSERYGEKSGYIQQWLFYKKRETEKRFG